LTVSNRWFAAPGRPRLEGGCRMPSFIVCFACCLLAARCVLGVAVVPAGRFG
jgi:hypothetical protein